MMRDLIDKLAENHWLSRKELVTLINGRDEETARYLFEKAINERHLHYGNSIFIRGLIEISNCCKNDCLYCGIRRSNHHVLRYRLMPDEILECCSLGYALGFRTFVLQGGEDLTYDDDKIVDLVRNIKEKYPDCAVTLSIGEKSYESYLRYFEAGADRYLLRHETANACHYAKLHPSDMSHQHRIQCLKDLKRIGYQTGTGFMVGSPFQTTEHIVEDLLFLADFKPEMVGIGPFIPHHETPFATCQGGTVELTVYLLAVIRLMLPKVLLPATTALGTIAPDGRNRGILAGANVIMPNLSPESVRKKYMIYDNKLSSGLEAAEYLEDLRRQMNLLGYEIVQSRGDALR